MLKGNFTKVLVLILFVVGAKTKPASKQSIPTALSASITKFSLDLYKRVDPEDGKAGNKFTSPFSVLAALMFTMLGTGGNTKTQLMSALHLDDVSTDNIHREYKNLQNYLNNALDDDITLGIANRLFPNNVVSLSYTYEKNAKNFYNSGVEPLNFTGDPEGSRARINDWASNKTNNLIDEVLEPGSVGASSIMFLVNAIYFQGYWKTQFNKSNTAEADFYITNKNTAKVDMMNMKTEEFMSGYNNKFNCKVLELPYTGENVSMLFVLPDSIDGISALEQQLSKDMLDSLYSSMHKQRTIVSIPKFEMKSKFSLIDALKGLGVQDLFDFSAADFSGMFSPQMSGIAVTRVDHHTFVTVEEEGTEAAAVTVVEIRKSLPMTFNANHPFLFIIREKQTGTILFIGRYAKP